MHKLQKLCIHTIFNFFCEHALTDQKDQPRSVGKWTYERKIGTSYGPGKIGSVSAVAFAPNDDIIIQDSRTNDVKIYNKYGGYKSCINLKTYPNTDVRYQPVVVDSTGDIYVQGGQKVVALDRCGKRLDKWIPVPPERIEAKNIHSMAINAEGNLLIGFYNYISKYKVNGEHLQSFPIHLCPDFIASTPAGTVVVCDRVLKCVQVVNELGEVLHTLQHTDMKQPWSVCCSKNMILVCDCNSRKVFCFLFSAQFVGSITGRRNRWNSIAVNSQGTKLVLGNYSKVELYMQQK